MLALVGLATLKLQVRADDRPSPPSRASTVAVFGLGGSGLATARALAGGRRAGAGLGRQAESVRAKAPTRRGHSPRRPARSRLVANSPRWCCRPACRSPIPRRTGRSEGAPRPASRSSATSSCSPRAPPPRAGRAVRRHHRHQRQVDHHRADRPPAARGRLDVQMGGNIGTAILALEPPRCGRRLCARAVVLPDRPDALARPDRRHPAQHHAGPPRPARHDGDTTPPSRSGWSPACSRRAPPIIGIDDAWCRSIADRLDAGRQARGRAISVKRPLADGVFADRRGHLSHAAGGGERDRRPRRHRLAARPAQRAERGRAPSAARGARARRRIQPGLEELSRPRAPHGAGGPRAARSSSSTTARPPTPTRPRRRCPPFADIYWIAGGKPKEGGIGPRRLFPAHRKAYLIGEAAEDFAATLGGKVPFEISARSTRRSAPRRRRGGLGRRAGRAALAGLRLLRPVPQFRGARRRLPRPRPRAAGGSPGSEAPRDRCNRRVEIAVV